MTGDSFIWHLAGAIEFGRMPDSEERWLGDHVGRSGNSRGLIAENASRAEAEAAAAAADWLPRYGFRRRLALVSGTQ